MIQDILHSSKYAGDKMKKTVTLICFIFLGSGNISCSHDSNTRENFYRGMYEGAYQLEGLKGEESNHPPDQEKPSYDQYKKERQEILTSKKKTR